MPFGFGGSTSSTDSRSQSTQQSNAASTSAGSSQSFSQDSIAFEDIFARMFGGAEGAAGGLDPSMLTDAANQLFSGGLDVMNQLGGDAGSQYLEGRLGENDVLQQQIDLLGEDLGGFFNEQLMPGITSQAVGGGALGGGRQGVAQGMAADQVGDLFTQGATALRAGDMQARDAAAGVLAGNAGQNAMTSLQGLPGLAGLADMGFGAAMSPYERLAGILGGPTTLTNAGSTSADFANSFSNSFAQSTASSRSRGKSVKLGF